MAQRRKHYRVDELPDEIQVAIRDAIQDGVTYRAIADQVRGMGHQVAPSSLCRYGQDFLKRMERLRTVNEQAKAILQETDGSPLRLEEAATQISLGLMTEALLQMEDMKGAAPVDLVRALAHLQSSSVARERLRIQWRAEQTERAKAAAADVCQKAKAGGLSDQVIREIEERILGITG